MNEIKISKTEWDLSPIHFDSEESFGDVLERLNEANDKFASKWRERLDYLSNPTALRENLDELEKLLKNLGNSGTFGRN